MDLKVLVKYTLGLLLEPTMKCVFLPKGKWQNLPESIIINYVETKRPECLDVVKPIIVHDNQFSEVLKLCQFWIKSM